MQTVIAGWNNCKSHIKWNELMKTIAVMFKSRMSIMTRGINVIFQHIESHTHTQVRDLVHWQGKSSFLRCTCITCLSNPYRVKMSQLWSLNIVILQYFASLNRSSTWKTSVLRNTTVVISKHTCKAVKCVETKVLFVRDRLVYYPCCVTCVNMHKKYVIWKHLTISHNVC